MPIQLHLAMNATSRPPRQIHPTITTIYYIPAIGYAMFLLPGMQTMHDHNSLTC